MEREHSLLILKLHYNVLQIMLPYNYIDFVNILTDHVNKKLIPMSRIDDAVRRILSVKFMMGLFENPMSSYEYIPRLGCQVMISYTKASFKKNLIYHPVMNVVHNDLQEHRDLGREAVRKSLVLLKNGKTSNAPLLPLPKKANRILVAGTHANNLAINVGAGVSLGKELAATTTLLVYAFSFFNFYFISTLISYMVHDI